MDSLVGIDTQLGKSTGKPTCIFSTMTITNKTYNIADGGFRVSIENVCKREVTCVDFLWYGMRNRNSISFWLKFAETETEALSNFSRDVSNNL